MSSPPTDASSSELQNLRDCLGKFATGVAVVTCTDADGNPCGITANSFSSVSLQPPLILWNIAKVSNSLQAYLDAEHFAINILTEEQQSLSSHFASTDHTRFDRIKFDASASGVPLLPGTLACIECRTYEIHDCGDHHIIVGEIENYRFDDRRPLLFFGGQYRELPKQSTDKG